MSLTDVVFTVIIMLVLAAMVVPAIITLTIEIKCIDLYIQYRFKGGNCWGMAPCSHPDCRLRYFCPMYQNAITPEVLAKLNHLLEERRRELEAEDEQ